MRGLLKKLRGMDGRERIEEQAEALDIGELCRWVQLMPIGGRLRLRPEFKTVPALESVVLAYFIDGHLVYGGGDVIGGLDDDQLVLRRENRLIELSNVREFSLVVPALPSGLERLTYDERAELGDAGGLARGNHVQIALESGASQFPVIDSVVMRRTTLGGDHYTGHQVAMLALTAKSLRMEDKRRSRRLKTQLPVALHLTPENVMQEAEMLDYSDGFIRLRMAELCKPWHRKNRLIVTVKAGEMLPETVFRAQIFKEYGDETVLEFKEIMKRGRFSRIEPVDLIGFKSGLLQHPATQPIC